MLKEYLKIAFRNMKRHKGYTFVNILGLTAGMFCVSLYMLLTLYEYSFDNFHKDADQIYYVYVEEHSKEGIRNIYAVPYPLAKTLREKIPGIKNATIAFTNVFLVKSDKYKDYENPIYLVDPHYFKIFSFPVLMGNPDDLLPNAKSIIINDKMAKKYFGNQNPIGKTLTLQNHLDLVVTGVIHIPDNSYFIRTGFFIPTESYSIIAKVDEKWKTSWDNFNFFTYIKVNNSIPLKKLEKDISNLLSQHNPGKKQILKLLKFKHIHFIPPFKQFAGYNHLFLFTMITVFILLIACINFINLTTAKFEKRFQEFKLRRINGAKRSQLIYQFLSESLILITISFFFVLLFMEMSLPFFNKLWLRKVSIDFLNLNIFLGFFGIILYTIIISNFFPILILFTFKPSSIIIKRCFTALSTSTRIRNFMLISQLSLSTLLIIATLIIYSQVKLCHEKNLGIDIKNIIWTYFEIDNQENLQKYKAAKNELLKIPGILSVTSTANMPFFSVYFDSKANWQGKAPGKEVYFGVWSVEEDFIPTFNLKIIKGRNFHPDDLKDNYNVILNEEALRQMNLKSPIGKKFELAPGLKGKIIGVIKDFHMQSLEYKINPLALCFYRSKKTLIITRLKPGDHKTQIKHIKKILQQFNSNSSYKCQFLNELYKQSYKDEERIFKILLIFLLISMLITCLGVFALSYFKIEGRTKEIGIRKAVGSTVIQIVWLISKEFLRWIFISTLIAWPIAFIIMKKWLNQYAYHMPLTIWPFLIASAITLIITLTTISLNTIRAANANPVDALRDE